MKISKKKIVWFLFSCIISAYAGWTAYHQPEKFIPLIDLLGTIVSILIGISLAISAVLSSRPSIGAINYNNAEEKSRIEKILKSDDCSLIEGQNIIFWFYYGSLILAVIFKWITATHVGEAAALYAELYVKIIATLFGFISSLALLWSATLPTLLRSVSIQRKYLD